VLSDRISKTSHLSRFIEFSIRVVGFNLNYFSAIPTYSITFHIGMVVRYRIFQKTLFENLSMFWDTHG